MVNADRLKARIWIALPSLPFHTPFRPGPKRGGDLLPPRCTPNEYWVDCQDAKALQLFDFGLSVLPIFVFRSRICICLCVCVCVSTRIWVWLCRLPKTPKYHFQFDTRQSEIQRSRYCILFGKKLNLIFQKILVSLAFKTQQQLYN